jgi:hypothetical protein
MKLNSPGRTTAAVLCLLAVLLLGALMVFLYPFISANHQGPADVPVPPTTGQQIDADSRSR